MPEIEVFGKRCSVDLTREQAIAALTGVEYRVEQRPDGHGVRVYINYQDSWLFLGRCDLMQQVHTSISWSSDKTLAEDPIKFYRDGIRFGAYVKNGAFYVIDSLTDG